MTPNELRSLQALPLEIKIAKSKLRIEEWYNYFDGNVYVSFSGGKDSTVLLDIVRSMYKDVVAVFVDTGLEYPEIRKFVKEFHNVEWLKPKMSFANVVKIYGYPLVSKKVSRMIRDLQNPTDRNFNTRNLYLTGIKSDGSKSKSFKLPNKYRHLIDCGEKISDVCCKIMKKDPIHEYEKRTGNKGFIGTMADDSQQRKAGYLQTGCNSFKTGKSNPLGFWLNKDIDNYIALKQLDYCSIYDTGVKHTGCMFCMFGVHLEKHPNRFEIMKETHPVQYDYCINKMRCGKMMDLIGVKYGNDLLTHYTKQER